MARGWFNKKQNDHQRHVMAGSGIPSGRKVYRSNYTGKTIPKGTSTNKMKILTAASEIRDIAHSPFYIPSSLNKEQRKDYEKVSKELYMAIADRVEDAINDDNMTATEISKEFEKEQWKESELAFKLQKEGKMDEAILHYAAYDAYIQAINIINDTRVD